jgi:hypothetical protein
VSYNARHASAGQKEQHINYDSSTACIAARMDSYTFHNKKCAFGIKKDTGPVNSQKAFLST